MLSFPCRSSVEFRIIKASVFRYYYEMRKLRMLLFGTLAVLLAVSCSTKKNTGLTRRVQAFKARYNTYFNGHVAFQEGLQEQREGNKDNYTEIIPVFMTGNKATLSLGKSKFDRTIEKCQKTIKQHTITKRPEWPNNKPKKPKDKIWLSQKEYNPFLYRAWFLMGEAQFQQGDFMEAATTFAYIQRLYFSKPDIVARARMLEAKCYAELEWFYDAENLMNAARRDSFPTRLNPLRAAVQGDCQVRQRQYAEAIPNIQLSLKYADGTVQKARRHFLLGQLYHQTGDNRAAFKEFRKVIRLNPPYELEFNARIQQTEVMSKGQSKQMIRKLQRMAKNPKNKDYLDQVYYAIGNIYLANGDTTRAIWAYNDGVEKSTRGGVEKGVVWMHLGQLYWNREQFVKAQPCYAGVLGLFDKERDDYEEIDERSKILDELLPYASAVELQDSLQALARMDSVERLKVIDRIIAEVKKKEKEEARKAAEVANATGQTNVTNTPNTTAANTVQNRNQASAVWYFYNPTAVAAGKKEFQKQWGDRKLEDDWRRSNKTVLDDFGSGGEEQADTVALDSLAADSTLAGQMEGLSEEEQEALQKAQEYAQDPHRREYYLKDIPLTEEQMAASNAALVDGLYNSAIIYKDEMENFPLAERTFQRILTDFPDFEHTDETCYNLFQLYSRIGRDEDAADYRNRLISSYPDNEHAKLVADPNFEFKGRYGKQIEDSLYQEAYDAFQTGDYAKVIDDARYTEREYPQGANRARFMFLESMSRLERGERDQFLSSMRRIVETYPQSTVSELAGLYVKGLKEGRILASGKMDMGSIWSRRAGIGFDEDSLAADTVFSPDQVTDFVFVIAYEHDSIDENQLLYEVARYDFSNFAVRNFDISIERGDGIDMLQVRTFLNYDEAYIYLHRLYNDADMAYKLAGLKAFIISERNLRLLMRGRSFADYFEFYDRNFDKIPAMILEENNSLDEPSPADMPTQEELEKRQEEEEEWDGYGDDGDDNYIF